MIHLIEVLNQISPWVLAIVIIAVAELYAVGLMLATRARCGADYLSLNNEVAGFKFAVIGVLYAVLLAFVVVAVWEDYQDTETAVRNEAKALSDLHQVSFALPETAGEQIRKHVSRLYQRRSVVPNGRRWPRAAPTRAPRWSCITSARRSLKRGRKQLEGRRSLSARPRFAHHRQ